MHHLNMDNERLEQAKADLDKTVKNIKVKNGYADSKSMGKERKRLAAAVLISASVTVSLAVFFLLLSSAGSPSISSISEQKTLIEELDGIYWISNNEGELAEFFALDRAGDIKTERKGDCLVLDLGELSVSFYPTQSGLSAVLGRNNIYLSYSEGRDGRARTISLRSPSRHVSLFVQE